MSSSNLALVASLPWTRTEAAVFLDDDAFVPCPVTHHAIASFWDADSSELNVSWILFAIDYPPMNRSNNSSGKNTKQGGN